MPGVVHAFQYGNVKIGDAPILLLIEKMGSTFGTGFRVHAATLLKVFRDSNTVLPGKATKSFGFFLESGYLPSIDRNITRDGTPAKIQRLRPFPVAVGFDRIHCL